MRPKGTKPELEARRRRGAAMLRAGRGVREVARRLGVSPGSVTRWKAMSRRGGKADLKSRPQTRRTGRLTAAQRNRLGRFLARPPESHGFRATRWTLPLVARLIRKHFGVKYHPGHVWRIVRSLYSITLSQRRERRGRRDKP